MIINMNQGRDTPVTVKVWDITFTNGRALYGAGAYTYQWGRLECYRCHFRNNVASWFTTPSGVRARRLASPPCDMATST